MKRDYPYYRPAPVVGTPVKCNPQDVPIILGFLGCLKTKGIASLSFTIVDPCIGEMQKLVDANTDCYECFVSGAFMDQITTESNTFNTMANITTGLSTPPALNPVSRCIMGNQDRYIYKGGHGFLVLSKKPIKKIDGTVVPISSIGISSQVKTTGLMKIPSIWIQSFEDYGIV